MSKRKDRRVWATAPPEGLPWVEYGDAGARLAWLVEKATWAIANNVPLIVHVPKFRPKTAYERLGNLGLVSPADVSVLAPPTSILVGPGGTPLSREVPNAPTRT